MSGEERERVRQQLYEELGWIAYEVPWLEDGRVDEMNERRGWLLSQLTDPETLAASGLKPHHGPLSPGCEACIRGTWSCLFLNHVCNANCFWCLREPGISIDPPPTAHGLDFPDPDIYADYLLRAGYDAVGISGGEPFLLFDKLREFVRILRNRLGPDAWIWVYTNGTLATRERVSALVDVGLNEVRVDLAATGYAMKTLRRIAGAVPVLTVEIPCLPEDEERLNGLLPELEAIGVDHLNLHQLTANRDNVRGYLDRGYTFLHSPALTVLESEEAALRLTMHARDLNLKMGVQVCTKPYKQTAQGQSRRMRALQAGGGLTEWETLTEASYLREVRAVERPSVVGELVRELTRVEELIRALDPVELEFPLWKLEDNGRRALLSPRLLPFLSGLELSVQYSEPRLLRNSGNRAVGLGAATSPELILHRRPVLELSPLSDEESLWLRRGVAVGEGSPPARIQQFEKEVNNGSIL